MHQVAALGFIQPLFLGNTLQQPHFRFSKIFSTTPFIYLLIGQQTAFGHNANCCREEQIKSVQLTLETALRNPTMFSSSQCSWEGAAVANGV